MVEMQLVDHERQARAVRAKQVQYGVVGGFGGFRWGSPIRKSRPRFPAEVLARRLAACGRQNHVYAGEIHQLDALPQQEKVEPAALQPEFPHGADRG